jgi:DNA-binding transcriptional ArsR family regulator
LGRKVKGEGAPPELKGNALRVYLHVLRHGPCELRDVQHALGLSTPSLASYHLGRLAEAGYVTQSEDGKYRPLRDASVEILAGYSRIGIVIVPQYFFFALLCTMVTAFFAYKAWLEPAYLPYLVATAGGCVAALWYETIRLWRRLAAWR